MTFSERTDWNLAENDFAAAVRERRAAGNNLVDLTVSNPTLCGFAYDREAIFAGLADPAALQYRPDTLGMTDARKSVARYYRDLGAQVDLERICLTTSTSEAYSFLFRLLCDPGDEVLVAQPSYPLFEYIARLDDVVLREYSLLYDPNADDTTHGWTFDLHELEAAISPRTRAIILVHPNNPTGNFVSAGERVAIEVLCAEHGLALMVDEVFLDYAIGDVQPQSFACSRAWGSGSSDVPQCLTFVLSGISKVCALPQMKVSWIVVCGPEPLTGEAMARIEVIADTFLSMNAPMQLALPRWLAERHGIQQQIRERTRANLAALDDRLRGSGACSHTGAIKISAQRLALEGGGTAVLRVPRTVGGNGFAEAALARGVLVQPGEFYGLPQGRAVLSLLTPPELWTEGLLRLPIEAGEE
jgi:alanine-synthesizing transaminase